jgi:RNA polymerase-interacting CarD/CdnL/TRCF family regulator
MFQAGDNVIHWAYGPGKIVKVEEKQVDNETLQYYKVQVNDLTIWVPLKETEKQRLRNPTPAREFKKLVKILSKGGEPLSEDRLKRKAELLGRLQAGKIDATCKVIRDLVCFARLKKLSESDSAILERAEKFLLDEWVISLETTPSDAREAMSRLLADGDQASS